jgi:hypothetical protein
MSLGITRKNGWVKPGSFYGYQTRYFTVAGAGFYTDGASGYTNYVSNSVFENAVRAAEQLASVTIVGTPTSAGFVIAVDGDTLYGRDDATGYAADGSAVDLAGAIYAATNNTCTVTEVILSGVSFTGGTVAPYSNI